MIALESASKHRKRFLTDNIITTSSGAGEETRMRTLPIMPIIIHVFQVFVNAPAVYFAGSDRIIFSRPDLDFFAEISTVSSREELHLHWCESNADGGNGPWPTEPSVS